MENSINTNESSGKDIILKKPILKSEEKEEKIEIEESEEKFEKDDYKNKEKGENEENEENEKEVNEENKNENVMNDLKENNTNNIQKIVTKDIKNSESDEKIGDNSIKRDMEEDWEKMEDIQYSHSLLVEVEKYNIQKMSDNYNREDAKYKVLFLGDSGVGKSSLVFWANKKQFDSFYKPTVGFDLFNYIVKINGKVMKLQIWDTCGQEEFSMCNQSLFKNATIAIMVYSIISKSSFNNINKWVLRVNNLSKENTIFFLVGNKSDLFNQRQVTLSEGKNFGDDKFKFFVETSSKSGYNIDILFKKIVIYLYENVLMNQSIEEKDDSKIEEYISEEQSSSFLSNDAFNSHASKKCLECC